MKIPNLFAYYQKDEYIMNKKNINTLRTVELFAGVGGFPCQDYSVASTLKNSHGIVGKKGVL